MLLLQLDLLAFQHISDYLLQTLFTIYMLVQLCSVIYIIKMRVTECFLCVCTLFFYHCVVHTSDLQTILRFLYLYLIRMTWELQLACFKICYSHTCWPVDLVSGWEPMLEAFPELGILRTSVERSLLWQQPVQLLSALPCVEEWRTCRQQGSGGRGGWWRWQRRNGAVERFPITTHLFCRGGPWQTQQHPRHP